MLQIVATPIGHPQDITLRALETLRQCDAIIGEEFRVASTLLKKWSIENKEIYLLNEHTRPNELQELVHLCKEKNVALISDCGTPGFSDPGADLIAQCRRLSVPITSLPGASALTNLISLSSRKITQFVFVGFLPAKREERQLALERLKSEKRCWIVMDTPYRLSTLLGDLALYFPQDRALIAMNMTSPDEEILEGTFRELQKRLSLKEAEFMILRYSKD